MSEGPVFGDTGFEYLNSPIQLPRDSLNKELRLMEESFRKVRERFIEIYENPGDRVLRGMALAGIKSELGHLVEGLPPVPPK